LELGCNSLSFSQFPTLVKFIDAKENLSVQVHPSDEYALAYESSYGKTEMWYIVSIYLGLKKDVTNDELDAAIKDERLTEILNFYTVKAGECYLYLRVLFTP
jgi:mannose-6-phosphate isomerase